MAVKAGEAFVEILADSTKLQAELNKASRRLKSFASSVTKIGLQLVGLTAALSTPFIAGIKIFADFETGLAKIGTLLDNDTKQLGKFAKEIEKLSVEFGESTAVLASGLFDIVSASVPATEAIAVLRESVKLAKAGFTDTAVAADAITTVLNAFSLSSKDAALAADFLFQTAKAGKTDLAKLAPNIGKVATLAASAGVTLEEMGAALATLTRAGLSTEEATTSLVAVISGFLKPADESAKLAKKLGIELNAAGLKSEGLLSVFEKLEGLDTETIANLFPNIRAVKGILPIINNLKSFSKDVEDLRNRAGATDRGFESLVKTLGFLGSRVKQVGTAIVRSLGAALADSVKKAGEALLGYLAVVTRIVNENAALIISIAKVILVIGTVGAALLSAGIIFAGFAITLSAVANVIGAFVATLAFMFTPFGVLIGLAGILGAVMVTNFDLINKGMQVLSKAAMRLQQAFGSAFEGIVAAVQAGDLRGAFSILTASLNLVWVKLITELEKAWAQFKFFIVSEAANAFLGVVDVVVSVVNKIISLWNDLKFGILKIIAGIAVGAQNIFEETTSFVAKLIIDLDPTTSEDTKAAIRKSIDDETKAKNAARIAALAGDLSNIEEAKQAELKAIKEAADFRRKLAKNIVDELTRSTVEGAGGNLSKVQQKAQDDLNKARTELAVTITKTKESQEDRTDQGEGTFGDVNDSFAGIKNALDRARQVLGSFDLDSLFGDLATPGQRAITQSGGFSGVEVAGEVQAVAKQSLTAQQATAKNTKDILRNQRLGGETFA